MGRWDRVGWHEHGENELQLSKSLWHVQAGKHPSCQGTCQKAQGLGNSGIQPSPRLSRSIRDKSYCIWFSCTPGFVETEIFKKSGSGLFNGCCGRMMISNVASTPLQGAQTTLGWNLWQSINNNLIWGCFFYISAGEIFLLKGKQSWKLSLVYHSIAAWTKQ